MFKLFRRQQAKKKMSCERAKNSKLVLGNIKSRYWEHIPNIFSKNKIENMLGICSQYRLLMLPKTKNK